MCKYDGHAYMLREDLVHVQSGFNHLLVLHKVVLHVSERRQEHGLQQDLVASCNRQQIQIGRLYKCNMMAPVL